MWFVVPAHVSVILAAWLPGGRMASALTAAAAQFAVICLCDRNVLTSAGAHWPVDPVLAAAHRA